MKNKYKYPPKSMKIRKSHKVIIPDDIIVSEIPNAVYIMQSSFTKLQFNIFKCSKKKYRRKNIKWLFSQLEFRKNLKVQPTLKQFRELKKILFFIDNEVVFNLGTIAKMINNGVDDQFFRRFYLSYNLKSSDSKLNFICLYGYEKGIKLWKEHKYDRMVGENNPGYNHGGKLSPWSKKSTFYSEESKEKAKQTVYNNNSNPTYYRYYIERGYTVDEAYEQLIKLDRTFSLKKCIKNYGEEKGLKIFEDRQTKWQNTLKSKPQHVINDINKRKDASSLNHFIKKYGDTEEARLEFKKINKKRDVWSLDAHIRKYGDTEEARIKFVENCKLAGFNMQKPINDVCGKLYYIKFWNDNMVFWKIGITKNSIAKRFGCPNLFKQKYGLNYDIIFIKEGMLYDCYLEEQRILFENASYRISISYNGFKTSEAFKKDIYAQ